MKKAIIAIVIVIVCIGAAALYWFVFRKDLSDKIILPYISHQKPRIDPHMPSPIPIADKLDEVIFDGLFNVSATPSGIIYEDGLGTLVGIDSKTNVVTVKLKSNIKWHSSWNITMDKDKATIVNAKENYFTTEDLRFTLRRIQKLGSLSPDYILVSQAIPNFDFSGPNENNEIQFIFKGDRIWNENDVKEVLSFKVIPASSSLEAPAYTIGTGPYLVCGEYENQITFKKNPDGIANITNFILKPFIDNSTYTTELRNKNINSLLSTPFGAVSPILKDSTKFFYKSSIATSFFAILFNVEKLNLQQRMALRKLIDNEIIMNRFFKINTKQQRHIANYKGEGDNYQEYLNYSVFPTTSYYIEEEIVTPLKQKEGPDISVLPDTVRIQTCLNYDFKEELSDLVEIMNDPSLFHGKIKVSAVDNEEIKKQQYDAVLVVISGYRSNFLFDLFPIFLREPDFESYKINFKTIIDSNGKEKADPSCFTANKNFFRIDLNASYPEQQDFAKLLDYIYGFMSTHEIGDKQAYSRMIDQLEQQLALGAWLFSLPSLAYFSTQFDDKTIDLYGTASQLSTVEKWREKLKK